VFSDYSLDYLGNGSHVEAVSPSEIVVYPEPTEDESVDASRGDDGSSRGPTKVIPRRYLWRHGAWSVVNEVSEIKPWLFHKGLRASFDEQRFQVLEVFPIAPGEVFVFGVAIKTTERKYVLLSSVRPRVAVRNVDAGEDPPASPNARGPKLALPLL
jgi:hypothetical protein